MKNKIKIFSLSLAILAGCLAGCQEEYYFDGGVSSGEIGASTYNYLEATPKYFDTLTWVIQQQNLEDLVNAPNNTFFVPQDNSFDLFLKRLEMDPTPKSLDELPEAVKDTLGFLLKKYVIMERILAEDVADGKKEYINANDEQVSVFLISTPRGGVPGYGPKILAYTVPVVVENIITGEDMEVERTVTISTSDLVSTNGSVHVVGVGQTFGF